MTPYAFPETNVTYGPPPDLDESQCRSIAAYRGHAVGGSCDGAPITVVAYKLTLEEIEVLKQTGMIYFSVIGQLVPHYPSLSFHDATHPA